MLPTRKPKHAGFTLIEMLVVLITIALLITFAVPIYRRAVAQSRFNTLSSLTKSLATAQESYYLNNGHYATSQEELDVNYAQDEGVTFSFGDNENFSFVLAGRANVPNAYYVMFLNNSAQFASNIHCEAKTDDEEAMWLCQEGFAGEPLEHASLLGDGYTAFLISGDSGAGYVPTDYHGDPGIILAHGDTCSTGQNGNCDGVTASDNSTCSSSGRTGGCNDSTFTGNSTCETTQGSGTGCTGSSFSNNSTCDSHSEASCSNSDFDASACHASGGKHACGNGSTFTNNSTCYAYVSGGSRQYNSCGNSQYTNSTCVVDENATGSYLCSKNDYNASFCYSSTVGGCGGASLYHDGSECFGMSSSSCDKSTFTSGSICHAQKKGACSGSSSEPNTFDASSCYGDAENSCSTAIFKNNSVCYANKKGACVAKNGNSNYQSGSYCAGEYCPVGSPKQGGGTWQACPNAGNTGKTC